MTHGHTVIPVPVIGVPIAVCIPADWNPTRYLSLTSRSHSIGRRSGNTLCCDLRWEFSCWEDCSKWYARRPQLPRWTARSSGPRWGTWPWGRPLMRRHGITKRWVIFFCVGMFGDFCHAWKYVNIEAVLRRIRFAPHLYVDGILHMQGSSVCFGSWIS